MKTKAVRIYGEKDLRLEEFELPPIKDNEILAKVISDSLCMSSYKLAEQGDKHKRVRGNLSENPVIIGHEMCGTIEQVGAQWKGRYPEGAKFTIQPALNYKGTLDAPGYSYPHIGGNATYVILPNEVMEMDSLLVYDGDAFYKGSLAEPVSCIVGAFHASYHTDPGKYVHRMGIAEGGKMAILAGVGPMGLGAIDYALHCDRRPSLLVVTDIDPERLERGAKLFPPEEAAAQGVKLVYLNTKECADPEAELLRLTGGEGYDDVFIFAAVKQLIEQGDSILGRDGCLNFFAGPTDPSFSASLNFYNVHYGSHHLVGTSGGNTEDMRESLELMSDGRLNPVAMITHVGGLDAVVETTLTLPSIPGGKKLIYTGISMPLSALSDLAEKGKTDPVCAALAELVAAHDGLWSKEAEDYLLSHGKPI